MADLERRVRTRRKKAAGCGGRKERMKKGKLGYLEPGDEERKEYRGYTE